MAEIILTMEITIILGAGPSKAYERWPYPLLADLLSQMLNYATPSYVKNFKDENVREQHRRYLLRYGLKQRLYLAYALMKAYGKRVSHLENVDISKRDINQFFNLARKETKNRKFGLGQVFANLNKQEQFNYESVTRAHWALAHAISFYMLQMVMAEEAQREIGHIDNAHVKLINLISDLIQAGKTVNVIDFNYDCVLERAWEGRGENRKFGWDYGGKINVFHDDDLPISILAKENRYRIEWDGNIGSNLVKIIKPHGDMCTFLRGKGDIYYRGGKHSKATSAIFPLALKDIAEDDQFARSSIMPPTELRFRRHSSDFYKKELHRFKTALKKSKVFIIIGWSASGTDRFYHKIFRPIFRSRPRSPQLYVIDKSFNRKEGVDLQNNLKGLFGNDIQIKDMQMCGFNEAAVEKLRHLFLSARKSSRKVKK